MQGKLRDLSIALSLSDCLGPKKGTSILVRVAKLLRLSIVTIRIHKPVFLFYDSFAISQGLENFTSCKLRTSKLFF